MYVNANQLTEMHVNAINQLNFKIILLIFVIITKLIGYNYITDFSVTVTKFYSSLFLTFNTYFLKNIF